MNVLIKNIISVITYGTQGIAFILAIVWIIKDLEFEPVITSLALIGVIFGIHVEKWVNTKEKRKELLISLAHELYVNIEIATQINNFSGKSANPSYFPRYSHNVLDMVIASGMFTTEKDKLLLKKMFYWQKVAIAWDKRMNVTEIRVWGRPSIEEHVRYESYMPSAEVTNQTFDVLKELTNIVFENYKPETKIDCNSVLFDI